MNIRAIAAGLALSAALAAPVFAHPVDGAWKEQHNDTPGITTPAGFKLTIWMKVEGDTLHYYSENTTNAEKPYISEHVSKLDGAVAPFPNQTRFNQISTLLTEPHELQVLKMKDGDVIAGEFWTFSKDGKTAVRRGISKSPEGKSKAYQEHFVKVTDKPQHRKGAWPDAASPR
ncbi:hypothetical protein [Phenylobacterium sp.]|jgi:hypothetical protein|uniref:hypothetical protein n=1 Tax=Phenylobacterium sp. TaxID=1871053 RepID=UPI002F91D161